MAVLEHQNWAAMERSLARRRPKQRVPMHNGRTCRRRTGTSNLGARPERRGAANDSAAPQSGLRLPRKPASSPSTHRRLRVCRQTESVSQHSRSGPAVMPPISEFAHLPLRRSTRAVYGPARSATLMVASLAVILATEASGKAYGLADSGSKQRSRTAPGIAQGAMLAPATRRRRRPHRRSRGRARPRLSLMASRPSSPGDITHRNDSQPRTISERPDVDKGQCQ